MDGDLNTAAHETATVGIDLVDARDVEVSLGAHGERYLRRVYTEAEVADCRTPRGGLSAVRLAARFAAKEATFKALRVGDAIPPWRSVEVVRRGTGAPALRLRGAAAARARELGLARLEVSLTHEAGWAAAVVAGWGPRPDRGLEECAAEAA